MTFVDVVACVVVFVVVDSVGLAARIAGTLHKFAIYLSHTCHHKRQSGYKRMT
jgi:hypothetical protein